MKDIDFEMIRTMLLDDMTVPGEPFAETGKRVLSIASSVNVLGNHYMAMWLTEDGYLGTNLVEQGAYFRIGEEKVKAFVAEVRKHQAYRYIYEELDGEEEYEQAGEEMTMETVVGTTE